MDAYDIFKKLTKGLTFKHRVLGVKNTVKKETSSPKKVEPDIKEVFEIKEELLSEEDISEQESGNELKDGADSEDDLQLVDGVKVDKKKGKKKKVKTEDLQKKLELEEQNRFRNEHGIKAVGRHIPAALQDFTELVTRYKVSQQLVDVVTQCGYTEPTPVQRQTLPCLLEERQIFACAPTGSGKTAAFLLPLLHTLGAPQGGPRALVLCPTRELAHQIYREALRLSASTQLRCSVLRNIKESKVKEREATIRRSDILISTPNRLCYLLNKENVSVNLDKVKWLIIDEADKLFEGAPEEVDTFRQQLEVLLGVCSHRERRIAMFSATHTPGVAKWCRHHMRGLINITVGQRNAATALVEQRLVYCGGEAGKLLALRHLVRRGLRPPVLVFVQSKDRAKELFKELIYDGINVDVIHADRTQAQRENVVRSFRVGRIWVLICTELMGRGIDFRGVNLVLNYDFPPSAISYIHRIGRAGRAGQKGSAITFFTQDDVVNLRSIASVMERSGCEVPEYMLQLKQDANKRKRLIKKAPHRDHISTILAKRPDKRKLEDASKVMNEKTKATDKVNNAKNNKLRKIQNNKTQNKENKNMKNKNIKNKKTQKGDKRIKMVNNSKKKRKKYIMQ